MPIQLKREFDHPEALEFDLMEVPPRGFDMLTVYSPSESAVNYCVDLLIPMFKLVATIPSELTDSGKYKRIAAVRKKQTPLLKAFLFDSFNRATGGSDN